MPRLTAPSKLPSLVKAAFNSAKDAGVLKFFPTEAVVLDVNTIPFQIRFSPSIANKPQPLKPKPDPSSAPTKSFNPFENPDSALVVTPLPPSHIVVLNKFAIVPEHFLVITATFQPQTHLLSAADLAVTYACIEAYEGDDGRAANTRTTRVEARAGTVTQAEGEGEGESSEGLFAFFNSGPDSGASQPHRHVQFLPIATMREGLDKDGPAGQGRWNVLADALLNSRVREKLPFQVFAAAIRADMEPQELRDVYLSLYHRACAAALPGETHEKQTDGEARISYNLAMTRDAMVLCPRVAEGGPLVDAQGNEMEELALNGTVLAGTGLVKSQAAWDAVRENPGQVAAVLERIGVPLTAVDNTGGGKEVDRGKI